MRRTLIRHWKKLLSVVAAASAGFFLFAFPVMAQVDLGLNFATGLGLTTTDIRTTVSRIISYFLGFLGIVAVCIMLYAGFLWMTAGGNEEKVSTAKKWMINGVIGLIIIMSAFAITQFIFRAITGDSLGTNGGCLPGQVCSGGDLGGGSAGGFRIAGVTPSGPGPNNGGWPKNYALTVGFNEAVSGASVTASTLIVKKCNARVDGSGNAQAFRLADCSEAVSGTRTAEGGHVIFRPNATPGDHPEYFEGEFWYYLQAVGDQIQDTRGRGLLCPVVLGDISSPDAPGNLCDRAIAFSNVVDVLAPTVTVTVPSGRQCPATTLTTQAIGEDDFLVSRIDFKLDGTSAGLSSTSVTNNDPNRNPTPFSVDSILISGPGLVEGQHLFTAKAFDGGLLSSADTDGRYSIQPAHCCNVVQDGNATTAPFETGINCGAQSGCGLCNGSACTGNDQCQSGFCVNGVCVEQPIIENVAPAAAGPGSLITIRGRFFGTQPGTVVFMGNPTDTADDKVAAACATGAWHELLPNSPGIFEAVVAVPEGAVDGPIKLNTAAGGTDTTEGTSPPGWVGSFDVTTETLPGICSLAPSIGGAGSDFSINGTGFQTARPAESVITMGSNDVTLKNGGWTATSLSAIVPSVREGTYPVKVRVGGPVNGKTSNSISYAVVPPAGQEKPVITSISPDRAPPGSYITIQGRGFTSAGTVRFFFGSDNPQTVQDERDIAIGSVPSCSDYWHKNYVVIKVPETYDCQNPQTCAIQRSLHKVQIETASPPQDSNLVDFTVINGVAGPGLCSITPPAAPAGVPVSISGEGFGSAGVPLGVGPNSVPLNVVNFFKTPLPLMGATSYGGWGPGSISTVVPGNRSVKSSWPKTGPVEVRADNQVSSNTLPFTVADCNEVGGDAFCKQQDNALQCCSTGACDTQCGPLARDSAFGWRFSSDILPSLPIVLERSSCSETSIQSPSPFKNSQDACINTGVQMEFNTVMNAGTFRTSSVIIEDCGNGATAACPGTPVIVPYSQSLLSGNTVLMLFPNSSFTRKKWYRVTLVSTSTAGIKDALGRALDGDFNDVPGGNYTFMFRVRDSDQACTLAAIGVLPSSYTVDHQGTPTSVAGEAPSPSGFYSSLMAANCNPLICRANNADQYVFNWDTSASLASDDYAIRDPQIPHNLLQHPTVVPGGFCTAQWQPVIAYTETQSPSGVDLIASAHRTNDTLNKTGTSNVDVKFADPVVTEYAPKCTEACINGMVYARFNVPMDGSGNDLTSATNTITSNTVKFIKCRNSSCNPPYDAADQPATPQLIMMTERVQGYDLVKGVQIAPIGKRCRNKPTTVCTPATSNTACSGDGLCTIGLDPDSFYLVKMKGTDSGIKSSSGVSLKGLNSGDFFTWTFHTKNDSTPCVPGRAEIEPKSATLDYVSQRYPFNVIPFAAPDACSTSGQALDGWQFNWQWDKTNEGVIMGFLPDPITASSRVNTKPGTTLGCTASCLNIGSQNIDPQCGNGTVETGEDCDKVAGAFSARCDQATCLLKGDSPTCGNGTVEIDGEQCDRKVCVGGTAADAACSNAGEVSACTGAGGTCQFIPGCKNPATNVADRPDLDGKGCVWLGAVKGKAICGDGFRGDGESCDDGNTGSGDGCSNQCLNEGTLRSCLDVTPGDRCVNFCGNGRQETGEDTGCDLGSGNVAAGCDPMTCLNEGTSRCPSSTSGDCCGNTQVDPGEECDPGMGGAPGCTDRCLMAGSSYAYMDGLNPLDFSKASFCRDGAPAGTGEDDRCEQGVAPVDTAIDPFQAIVGGQPAGTSQTVDTFTSTLTATVSEITNAANKGLALVTLSRPCSNGNANACAQIGAAQIPPIFLGCTPDGTCQPAPVIVDPTYPIDGATNICRNTVVRVTFSQPMNPISVQSNMLVGEAIVGGDCGKVCSNDSSKSCTVNADCGAGGQCNVNRQSLSLGGQVAAAEPSGLFARLWNKVVAFLRGLFAGIVSAQATPTYCVVPGTISVIERVAIWNPAHALKQDTSHQIFIKGGTLDANSAKNTLGVPLQTSRRFYFQTGPEICKIDFVTVDPASHLFTTAEDLGSGTSLDENDGDKAFTAHAHPAGRGPDAEITTTEEYSFKWRWALQPLTSAIVVKPVNAPLSITNGWCEVGEAATSNDCKVDLSASTNPKPAAGCGNEICELTTETAANCPSDCEVTPAQIAAAMVTVRTGLCSNDSSKACAVDADCGGGNSCLGAQGLPKNGDEVVQVTADISERRVQKSHVSSSADVTVMLCNNPWPARKVCPANSKIKLSWDPTLQNCTPYSSVWYPFYDKDRDTAFYYCRDAQKAGDSSDLLPALKEVVVSVSPGRDVLKEYLFTFATPGVWQKDAIGFRIVTNSDHASIMDWYRRQGFRGAPSSIKVDGYEALQEGRTAYVNAAARAGSNLYTNVNILSYSEGSQPETSSIFGKMLANIDMNRNVKDLNYCIDAVGNQVLVKACSNNAAKACTKDAECWDGSDHTPRCRALTNQAPYPISCASDRDCRVDKAGKILPLRGLTCFGGTNAGLSCVTDAECLSGGGTCKPGYTCIASKSKLIRDVERWRDLTTMRDTLMSALAKNALPTLEAGTYLRSKTNSRWPSWEDALKPAFGSKPIPSDPINTHMECTGSGYDPVTCWNATDKKYVCPTDSNVYAYRSVGGQDFALSVDFEARCSQYITSSACTSDPKDFCAWNGAACVASASWSGSTCIEQKTPNACCPPSGTCDRECDWSGSSCDYKKGHLAIGGVNDISGICLSTLVTSAAGSCGDGVVQTGEACEPNSPPNVGSCIVDKICKLKPTVACSVVGTTDPLCGAFGPCQLAPAPRTGSQKRTCQIDCTWGAPDVCKSGVCGDGVVQAPENCDDGALNGIFNHCKSDCTGFGPRCGDTAKEINEACECGDNDGAYKFNGIAQTNEPASSCNVTLFSASAPTCSWDCSGPGPRCGDNVLNGPEQCDGDFQEFKGYCNDLLQTGCNTSSDCNFGACQAGKCANNKSVSCSANADCALVCGNYCPTVEQRNHRDCNRNDAASTSEDPAGDPALTSEPTRACRYSAWTCTAPGSCGNGKKETGEECDDGNNDNNDGCIIDPVNSINCKIARCADTYVNSAAGEQCDEGKDNGKSCVPGYGLDCNYCTPACKTGTVSGGFCGNSLVEDTGHVPPGPEECEQGINMDNWICLSSKPDDQPIGKYIGAASCGINNCKRTCTMPDTRLCFNNLSAPNTDRPPSLGGSAEAGTVITDACDPDKDNDAVPGVFDCNDTDASIHPIYAFSPPTPGACPSPSTLGSGQCNVAPAIEICDVKDNNCNGQTDEKLMLVRGKVKNGANNVGIAGASVQAFCVTEFLIGKAPEDNTFAFLGDGGLRHVADYVWNFAKSLFGIPAAEANHIGNDTQLLGSTTSDGAGNYRLDVPTDGCSGTQIQVEARPPGGSCFGPSPTMITLTKSEDCNRGGTDDLVMGETMTITGNVRNARTGGGVGAGVLVSGYCGAATPPPQNTTTTDAGGNYALVLYKTGCSQFTITAGNNGFGAYCESPSPTSVPVAPGCAASGTANPIIAAPRPVGGSMLIYVTWGASPSDLDFHMKTSAGECMGYRCGSGYGSASGATWDLDDTNGNGPETITINTLVPGRKYRFYVHNYSGGSFVSSDLKWQMWDSSCSILPAFSSPGGSASDRFWSIATFQASDPLPGTFPKVSVIQSPNTFTGSEPGNP